MTYYIKQQGSLIAGFSRTHQVIQLAGTPEYAKEFKSAKQAQKFLDKYQDAGYGLTSQQAEIIEA